MVNFFLRKNVLGNPFELPIKTYNRLVARFEDRNGHTREYLSDLFSESDHEDKKMEIALKFKHKVLQDHKHLS